MIPRQGDGRVPIDLSFYKRDVMDPFKFECERSSEQTVAYMQTLCPQQVQGSVTAVGAKHHEPQFVVVSDEYLDMVRGGKIQIVRRVEEVQQAEDQSFICKAGEANNIVVDSVVLCTGYHAASLDFLPQIVCNGLRVSDDQLVPLLLDRVTLPAYSVDWDQDGPESLSSNVIYQRALHERMAFVGMYRGPFFGIIELQARWVVHTLCVQSTTDSSSVPLSEVVGGVRSELTLRNRLPRPQFPHPDYVGLCNTLATAVGVLPKVPSLKVDGNDDQIVRMVRDGPVVPAHHRLCGVHADLTTALPSIKNAYNQLLGHE